ncbi:MAG: DnaJ domain-containing protein [Clostridia bacterium]|nr:DnaJ domain-containing protein [Clostridia bacterium]
MKNFYEVLRVRTNATQAQIKKAFISLVSKYHPDVYTGDKIYAERYAALLTEAYSVLKDPERRRNYDMNHNINTRPSAAQLRKEDKAIKRELREERKMVGKNYEQEMSMRYFKNSERKKPTKKSLFKKIFTSKLLYILLFIFSIEVLLVLFVYSR